MLDQEELKALYHEWFYKEYGIKPVITSSTGIPAVHFAQYVLELQAAKEASE